MSTEADPINIAFGIDAAYAPHAACVIASIVRHAPDGRFRFIVLHGDIARPLQLRVESVAPQASFTWLEISDDEIPELPAQPQDRTHLQRPTLFRLALARRAPADWRRVIYLDADLIVMRDIREIWRADLDGAPIGAAIDSFVDEAAFAKRWDLPAGGSYFNAGVLLLDLDQIRAQNAFSATLDFQVAHRPAFNDQDALNYVFWRRWKRLDNAWNIQRYMFVGQSSEGFSADKSLKGPLPGIVHYTGPEKPWVRGAWHPWAWLYWENLRRTPFFAEVARASHIDSYDRLRMRLRWFRRGPRYTGRASA
ncbi:MAG: glycosyltransferase family 8 protein [Hyphomonadaceae bacterium]|nr:glycosyltransferase family 8 protein [Hyphomonadaceae bacterium]